MIISGKEINKQCLEHNLITPFISNNLRNSSYDLTVGDEVYCGAEIESLRIRTTFLAKNDSFKIPAYGFAYILCNETIKLPHCMTARVSLRMSLIYKGLVLTVQPPFDPNYNGKVIVLLHNMSTDPIYLKRGERIVTIEFSYVFGTTPLNSLEIFDQPSVVSLQEKISTHMKSGSTELIMKDQRTNQRYHLLVIGLWAAVGVIATISLCMAPLSAYYAEKKLEAKYSTEIEGLRADVQKLQNQIEQQQVKITEYNKLLPDDLRD